MRFIVLTNGESDKSDLLLSNCGLKRYFDCIVSAEKLGNISLLESPICWLQKG